MALLFGIIVGISLGLTGGGGSIFAVPLLVYGLGIPLRHAVTVSLAVVGLTALFGAMLQKKNVRWLAGLIFGLGGIAGAPLGAISGTLVDDGILLLLFAALMIFVAIKMLRGGDSSKDYSRIACKNTGTSEKKPTLTCALKLLSAGAITGVLSGAFGVGGGFLVVPALLIVTAMPLQNALATSLVSIFLISVSGFISNLFVSTYFQFMIALWFFAGGATGMALGSAAKSKLPPKALRIIFATSVIAIALWTVWKTTTAQAQFSQYRGSAPQCHARGP